MHTFNILFYYCDSPHIASVQYHSFLQSYTIYFTDVELVLSFGSRAELKDNILIPAKEKIRGDLFMLQEAILEQINKVSLVA